MYHKLESECIMINESRTQYDVVVSNTRSAIKSDKTSNTKWLDCAESVAEYFQTEAKLDECKAQFCADTIIPEIDKKYGLALAVELPRMNSKAYKEVCSRDASYAEKWEIANQAKKDARSTIETYYKRVVKYAFPKEKTESGKKDFIARLSKLIEDGGKIKECNFDLVKTLQFLVQAETVAKTPIM
jgi:hypothetical protein